MLRALASCCQSNMLARARSTVEDGAGDWFISSWNFLCAYGYGRVAFFLSLVARILFHRGPEHVVHNLAVAGALTVAFDGQARSLLCDPCHDRGIQAVGAGDLDFGFFFH